MRDTVAIPDDPATRLRIRDAIARMSLRERKHVARLLARDQGPVLDKAGLAVHGDDTGTPELRRHAELATRHTKATGKAKAAVRVTRLEKLKLRGDFAEGGRGHSITASQFDAACRFSEDYTVGPLGVRDSERPMERIQNSNTPDGLAPVQLAALQRWREAKQAIGPAAADLVVACAVDDSPWAATAKRLGIDDDTVRSWTCAALAHLADHYAASDRARRTSRRR